MTEHHDRRYGKVKSVPRLWQGYIGVVELYESKKCAREVYLICSTGVLENTDSR